MPSEQTRSSAEETQKARKRDVSEAAEKALVVAQQVGEGLKSGVAKGASGVKKGIASALVRTVEDAARRIGYDRLYLFTSTAPSLYEGLGWKALEKDRKSVV